VPAHRGGKQADQLGPVQRGTLPEFAQTSLGRDLPQGVKAGVPMHANRTKGRVLARGVSSERQAVFAPATVGRGSFAFTEDAEPQRAVLQAVIYAEKVGAGRSVDREKRVLRKFADGWPPNLTFRPRPHVSHREARVGHPVGASSVFGHGTEENLKAALGRVHQRVGQAPFSQGAREDPVRRNVVNSDPPVVKPEAGTPAGSATGEPAGRGAAEPVAGRGDQTRVDEDCLQRCTRRVERKPKWRPTKED
jgi:hypothetical protein